MDKKQKATAIVMKDLLPNKAGKKMSNEQVINELVKMGIWVKDGKIKKSDVNKLVKAVTSAFESTAEPKFPVPPTTTVSPMLVPPLEHCPQLSDVEKMQVLKEYKNWSEGLAPWEDLDHQDYFVQDHHSKGITPWFKQLCTKDSEQQKHWKPIFEVL